MEIQLKNIGMIKEANVKLDGLTVIAGENDTGKSTVGKFLFSIIKANNISIMDNRYNPKYTLATRLNLVFDQPIANDLGTECKITNKTSILTAIIKRDKNNNVNFVSKFDINVKEDNTFFDATLIQTPMLLDMSDFFNSVMRMNQMKKFDYSTDFDINYPYAMYDLFYKISNSNPFPKLSKITSIDSLIRETILGEFEKINDKFYYKKMHNGKSIQFSMMNTAVGIKSFGLIQLLNNNLFLNKKVLLILDEPEVHLHPKWQLKMAEVIVNLVKNGVKVLVNSHSPYMIEALELYATKHNINSNFYLAKKENEQSMIIDVTDNLESIYATLAEAIGTLEEESLENFKW